MIEDEAIQDLDEFKEYCEEIDRDDLVDLIDTTEETVEREGDIHVMRDFEEADLPLPEDMAATYRFGVVVGTFLEHEYPRYIEDGETDE